MPTLPTPTPVTSSAPYAKFSLSKFFFVPTIAVPTVPTLAEFNAGKDLTLAMEAISGFSTSAASLDVPRAGTYFTGSLPGRVTAADSSISYYLDQAGPATDVRSVFNRGQVGWVAIANEGLGTSATPNKCDLFHVRVGSIEIPQDLEAVAMATVSYFIFEDPTLAVTIPVA